MCEFLHYCLMLAGFESKAWMAPLLSDESENERCKILTKNKTGIKKKSVLLIYYLSFTSNLMLPTLMLRG